MKGLARTRAPHAEQQAGRVASAWAKGLTTVERPVSSKGVALPGPVQDSLVRTIGGGVPLDPKLKPPGVDLGSIRVHADRPADGAARAMGADALAWGSDLYFRQGRWAPETAPGRHLLFHELAHAWQTTAGGERVAHLAEDEESQAQAPPTELELRVPLRPGDRFQDIARRASEQLVLLRYPAWQGNEAKLAAIASTFTEGPPIEGDFYPVTVYSAGLTDWDAAYRLEDGQEPRSVADIQALGTDRAPPGAAPLTRPVGEIDDATLASWSEALGDPEVARWMDERCGLLGITTSASAMLEAIDLLRKLMAMIAALKADAKEAIETVTAWIGPQLENLSDDLDEAIARYGGELGKYKAVLAEIKERFFARLEQVLANLPALLFGIVEGILNPLPILESSLMDGLTHMSGVLNGIFTLDAETATHHRIELERAFFIGVGTAWGTFELVCFLLGTTAGSVLGTVVAAVGSSPAGGSAAPAGTAGGGGAGGGIAAALPHAIGLALLLGTVRAEIDRIQFDLGIVTDDEKSKEEHSAAYDRIADALLQLSIMLSLVILAAVAVEVIGRVRAFLKDRKPAAPHAQSRTKSGGQLLAGADDEIVQAVQNVKPKPGYTDVIVHGTEDAAWVKHNGDLVKLDHRSLARWLKGKGVKGPIRLLACGTGAPDGFARNLANKLGVEVLAPSESLWVLPSGALIIGDDPTHATGSWKSFIPEGPGEGTSVTSADPVQAPPGGKSAETPTALGKKTTESMGPPKGDDAFNQWYDDVRSGMTPDEVAKLEQMTLGKSPEQVRGMLGRSVSTAKDRVRAELEEGASRAARSAQSKVRVDELRQKIADDGLMETPAVQGIVDATTPTNLSSQVPRLRDAIMADILRAETQAANPGREVLVNVKIFEKQPEATLADWRAKNPGKAADGYTQRDDGLYKQVGELDQLVIERQPAGAAKVIAREEIKTGVRDTPGDANQQLADQARLLAEGAQSPGKIRLEQGGVDITQQIDLASDATSTKSSRGPSDKNFTLSLGVTSGDLEALCKEILREAVAKKSAQP